MTLAQLVNAPVTLARDMVASRRRPILIVGLPRSGSSWLGNVLATAESTKYYREPYSSSWHPKAASFQYLYVRADDENDAFDAYTANAFEGRVPPERVNQHAWLRYRRYPMWPGRVLVKEVHAILAAERIERLTGAAIVVVIRHPASLAASWRRLGATRPVFREWQQVGFQFENMLTPKLIADRLSPYMDTIESARRPSASGFERVGAIWGTVYRVLTDQAQERGWTVVTHENLCSNPEQEFRKLFRTLDLQWTSRTMDYLCESTMADSGAAFVTRRVSKDEIGKWREELTQEEAQDVNQAAQAFGLNMYLSS